MWRIGNPEKEWSMPATFINHGICPNAKEQQPTQSFFQGLPSPAWHLAVPIDWVKYQHSVNQSQFSGSKGVSQGSACSHREIAAQRREVLGSAPAAGWLWDDCQGPGLMGHEEQQALISLVLSLLNAAGWQQRPARERWERTVRGNGKAL